MVLEAVMVCLDNSDYMRNGDYRPTRFEAQNETVNFIANAKIQGNPETTVGFLTMAGRVEVHVNPNRSVGQIMTCLKEKVKISGEANFVAGLKVAQLALKNRQNKNQRQRVIMFVGSPVVEETKKLVKLGKNFKKNNVAVDIVNFGDENASNENTEKLEAFINAVNSSDNSHLVNIPPGPHILSDLVMTSAIMVEAGAGGVAMAGAGAAAPSAASGGGGFGGVDPNVDPELAMVLRMSMEEERQRQERAAKEKEGAKEGEGAASSDATPATPAPGDGAAPMEEEDDEDDEEALMLAQAIAMSMAAGEGGDDDNDKDTDMAKKSEDEGDEDDIADALKDPDFINSLLDSVEGVDKDDIGSLDDILGSMMGDDDEKDNQDKK
jgi:26S proteasome regulatory subunit N10